MSKPRPPVRGRGRGSATRDSCPFSLHYSLDKQRALAVFYTHDERNPIRYELRFLRYALPEVRPASQWAAPVPLPILQADVYRTAQADAGRLPAGCKGDTCAPTPTGRQLDPQYREDHELRPQHDHEPAGSGRGTLRCPHGCEDAEPAVQAAGDG